MYAQHIIMVLSMFLLSMPLAHAQNRPKFKITKRRKPPQCNGRGTEFKQGYVKTLSKERVDVIIYFQHRNGYWERKSYTRMGGGPLELNLLSCDYTGNYYAYCCVRGSANCKFPDEVQVESLHAAKDQTPKFKITNIKKEPCSGGTKYIFKKGFVYSPSGHQVEVTLFVEKKDGKWRKKHFFYYGSGYINIDMEGCDLTGKYRSVVSYTD